MNKPMTAAEAKAALSALLDRAEAGEETIITRRGKPVARLAPLAKPAKPPPRKPGRWKGLLTIADDAFSAPPTEQDLKDWEGDLDEFMAMTPEQSEAYSKELRAQTRRDKARRAKTGK
jgi:prevent-host-death family protein